MSNEGPEERKTGVITADVQAEWDARRKRLRSMPRVIKAKDRPQGDSRRGWRQPVINTENSAVQTLTSSIEHIPSGGASHKHGHQNEAIFYILEGKGYEIHDGVRYDWEAGDVAIVSAGCVHQHFNADPQKPATALVINPKPLYMFINLSTQKDIYLPPSG